MNKQHHFLTVLFGPIGDTLMAVALCDDILSLAPGSTFLFLTRRNAKFITELTSSYPSIEVRQIPGGLAALPFFASILRERWTLLTLGVTGVYSMRVKLFFLALKLIPGNRTIGFNDRLPGAKGWLPLQTVIQFDERYVIDNFRRLLAFVFTKEEVQSLEGRPPRVVLATKKPAGFTYAPGSFIAVNPFGSNAAKSLPVERAITLLSKIAEAHPAYPMVIIGGPREESEIIGIANAVKNASALPGLPLLEAAYVIDHAALYIGVDTGPTHIAGVLQQKSLVITNMQFPAWSPLYNPNARACRFDVSDEFIVRLVGGFFDEHAGKL